MGLGLQQRSGSRGALALGWMAILGSLVTASACCRGCQLPAFDSSRDLLETKVHGFNIWIGASFSLNTRRKAPADEWDYSVGVYTTHDSTDQRVRFEYPLSAQFQSKDSEKLKSLWAPIGLDYCQDPSGSPLVYRVNGVSPELDADPQKWRALFIYPTAVVRYIVEEPADDCEAVRAALPKQDEFLRAELRGTKDRLLATAADTSVFPRSINAGYVVSLQEGVNLPEALDFHFRNNELLDRPPNMLGALPDAISKGKSRSPDLEALFLAKLLPEAKPSDIPRVYRHGPASRASGVLYLLRHAKDQQRRVATAKTIAERCRQESFVGRCYPFRMVAAAQIAGEAKDAALCDAMVGFISEPAPQAAPDSTGKAAEDEWCTGSPGLCRYVLLHRGSSCASPSSVRRAARAALRSRPTSLKLTGSLCGKPVDAKCPSIHELAVSVLAAHCNEEVVEAAREWLSSEDSALAKWAPCLLARCGGPAELDRAVASKKLTEQQRTEAAACKLDDSWRPKVDDEK